MSLKFNCCFRNWPRGKLSVTVPITSPSSNSERNGKHVLNNVCEVFWTGREKLFKSTLILKPKFPIVSRRGHNFLLSLFFVLFTTLYNLTPHTHVLERVHTHTHTHTPLNSCSTLESVNSLPSPFRTYEKQPRQAPHLHARSRVFAGLHEVPVRGCVCWAWKGEERRISQIKHIWL